VPEPPKPPAQASSDEENIVDPNRPRLRRGKPDRTVHQEPYATFDAVPDAVPSSGAVQAGAASKDPATAVPPIVTIAAISDVGGPDPRPYTYDVKPAEEAIYRNKMLDLAAAQLGARAKGVAPAGKKSGSKSAPPPPKPAFGEVNLRIFDLSNSNEPVLVLSAITQPPAASATGPVEEPQEITLIARTNLEGELRKLFFQRTDAHHLDLIPRMELIDAVDADGDGRGELLFRRTFDVGTAYAIYRVAADRLWPLFEGKP
jgi:hypothetical protein